MKNKFSSPHSEVLSKNLKTDPVPSEQKTQKIIQEMRTEQIELESENQLLRSVQQKLKTTQKQYRNLFEYAPVGYFIFDLSGRIIEVNRMGAAQIEHEKSELAGKTFYQFITPESRSVFNSHLKTVFETETRQICDLTIRKACGTVFQAQLISTRFENQNQPGLRCQTSVIDITPRKKFEKELAQRISERTYELTLSEQKARQLAVKLMEAREMERKRISKELHDSAGSSLTAVQYALERKLLEIGNAVCEKKTCLEDIMAMVNTVADEVRRISRNLHPSVLEDLGIGAAVSAFVRQFQKLYADIRIKQEIEIADSDGLPEHLQLLIYRIIQESLNNSAKHSDADTIRLTLKQHDRFLLLTVEDNGKGFDLQRVDELSNETGGLGLQSMKERTEHFGGTFKIFSSPGLGTRIRAEWMISEN